MQMHRFHEARNPFAFHALMHRWTTLQAPPLFFSFFRSSAGLVQPKAKHCTTLLTARAAVTSLGVNIVTSSLMSCMDYITCNTANLMLFCCTGFEVIMRYMKNECIREALGEFRGIREKKNNNACIAAPHWCLKLEVCKTIKQKKTVRVYLFVRDRTRTLSVPAFPNTPWLTAKV